MRLGPRVIVAFLTGALAGIAVMVAVNVPVYHLGNWPDQLREYFGFWGVLFGAFAAPFAFGIALAILRREVVPRRASEGGIDEALSQTEPSRKKVGLLISAIVAGLFGLLVTYWNAMWGVPLTSLEGAWLWPLAIVPLGVSALLFRVYRRKPASEKP